MGKNVIGQIFFFVLVCFVGINEASAKSVKLIAGSDPRTNAVAWIQQHSSMSIAWQEDNDFSVSELNNNVNVWVRISAVDGISLTGKEESILALSAGEHEIEWALVSKKKKHQSKTIKITLPANTYYDYFTVKIAYLESVRKKVKWAEVYEKLTIETVVLHDVTDEVVHGSGEFYTFYAAEIKQGGKFLTNGVAKLRAVSGKKERNYGVYDLSVPPNQLVTLEIPGDLEVIEFDNKPVDWNKRYYVSDTEGQMHGYASNEYKGWVRIPAGKHTFVFRYHFEASSDASSGDRGGGLRGALFSLIDIGVAIHDGVKSRIADDITLTYEFFPNAFYEFKSGKDKTRNGNYATATVIPRKGAPKKQAKGVGTSLSDVAVSNNNNPSDASVTMYSVSVNGEATGPYTISELKLLAQKRQLTKETFVWKEGMAQWEKAGTIKELENVLSVVPPPLPPQ